MGKENNSHEEYRIKRSWLVGFACNQDSCSYKASKFFSFEAKEKSDQKAQDLLQMTYEIWLRKELNIQITSHLRHNPWCKGDIVVSE